MKHENKLNTLKKNKQKVIMKGGLKDMKIDAHKVKQSSDKLTIKLVKHENQCSFYFSLKEICERWNLDFDLQKDTEKIYDEFKYLFTFEDGETEEEDEIVKRLIDSFIILDKHDKDDDLWVNYDYLLCIMVHLFSFEPALSIHRYLDKKIFAYKCKNQDFFSMMSNIRG